MTKKHDKAAWRALQRQLPPLPVALETKVRNHNAELHNARLRRMARGILRRLRGHMATRQRHLLERRLFKLCKGSVQASQVLLLRKPEQLRHKHDFFVCPVFECTMSAHACLERQRVDGTRRGRGYRGGYVREVGGCSQCSLGQEIAERVQPTQAQRAATEKTNGSTTQEDQSQTEANHEGTRQAARPLSDAAAGAEAPAW